MTTTIVTITLALAMGGTGQCPDPARCPYGHQHHHHGMPRRLRRLDRARRARRRLGLPQRQPDGYGWHDPAPFLPLGGNRIDSYFFPRYFAVPPEQAFMGTYYNPYVMRGQRYLPYTGNGGCHPMGGPAPDTAVTLGQALQLADQQPARHPGPAPQRPRRGPGGELRQDRADALSLAVIPAIGSGPWERPDWPAPRVRNAWLTDTSIASEAVS